MSTNITYSVVYLGELHAGFEILAVEMVFATLFSVSNGNAREVLAASRTLKMGVSYEKACAYKIKLEQIGLRIRLQADKATETIALEPFDTKSEGKGARRITCPKCHFEQVYAEKCQQCGVCIHNVQAHNGQPAADADRNRSCESDTVNSLKTEKSTVDVSVIVGAGFAGVVGALVWYFVAITFDYELGLLALCIGGMVGYAAVMFGGRGEMCAIICGGFALLSIASGKYLAVQGWQYQAKEEMLAAYQSEAMRPIYRREKENGKRYKATVVDDISKREFIVANGYAVVQDVSELTQEDVDFFNRITAPRLEEMAAGELSFDAWGYASLGEAVEGLSVSEIVDYSFGWIDFILILLGVGTAYRLGRGECVRL